jgi:hypothetical protein
MQAMTQDGWGGSKTKEAEKKSQAIDKVAGAASQKDGGENDDDWGAFLRELGFAEPAPEAGQVLFS